MVEFAYNNIMHSSTQQTPFFVNHGLHPKFDIQSVNKVMNPTTKDRTMWLVGVWFQLVSNLEKMRKWFKENVDEHQKEQPNFKVKDYVWFKWQHIKTTRPLQKLNNHRLGQFLICETNQCRGFPIQVFRFYENPSCVSCFLIKFLPYASIILRRIHDPPPPIEIDGE
jgi:hypothetical protein